MKLLFRAAGLALALTALSCVSAPPASVPTGNPGAAPAGSGVARIVGPGPEAGEVRGPSADLAPTPLDLELWPFGWVKDPGEGPRLGLGPRFWSDQKPLWRSALDPATRPPAAVALLSRVYHNAGSDDEALRAAWRLWLVHAAAGLADTGRPWLDRVCAADPAPPAALLARLWDQVFRLGDRTGARDLWPAAGFAGLNADDGLKARLLRQKLFLGTRSLGASGADDYVSTLALDRDDLWVGTWNGSVVRWSLATGTLEVILAPATVAPVTRLAVTGWFVYAFQDQTLLRYSKVTGTWRSFPYPPGWSGLRVTGAVADGQESLWVAHLGEGLWKWTSGRWTLADAGGGGPFLTALAPDGRGGFWVGTKDRGLWSWNSGSWLPVPVSAGQGPSDISVLAPGPDGGPWAVGTWGEGTWTLDRGQLVPGSRGREFVISAAWSRDRFVWGTLDEGLVTGQGADRSVLGPRDGLPAGGVSSLVDWEGRWIWGTTGQGLGWWSEHENPALLR